MTSETETVADVLAEARNDSSHTYINSLCYFDRIAAAHAREAKDAARYRWLRDIGGTSTIMFTLAHRREIDEWDEEIDAAMPRVEVLR